MFRGRGSDPADTPCRKPSGVGHSSALLDLRKDCAGWAYADHAYRGQVCPSQLREVLAEVAQFGNSVRFAAGGLRPVQTANTLPLLSGLWL